MRVAVATNCIPPYRYPVFRQLSDNPALTLRIFVSLPLDASSELARSTLPIDHPLTINFRLDTRHVEADTRQTEAVPLPMGLIWALLRFWPEVIVSGDFGPRSLLCWLIARIVGAKFLIWTEEIQSSARGRSSLQRKLRRFLLPRADGFFSWGEPARDYLLLEGVALDRITVVPQSIDVDGWNSFRPPQSRDVLRGELGFVGITFLRRPVRGAQRVRPIHQGVVFAARFRNFTRRGRCRRRGRTLRRPRRFIAEAGGTQHHIQRPPECRGAGALLHGLRCIRFSLTRRRLGHGGKRSHALRDAGSWQRPRGSRTTVGHRRRNRQRFRSQRHSGIYAPAAPVDRRGPALSRDACRALAESLHPTVGANAISARLLRELSD